jgi:hypothetical protein
MISRLLSPSKNATIIIDEQEYLVDMIQSDTCEGCKKGVFDLITTKGKYDNVKVKCLGAEDHVLDLQMT